MRRIKFNIGNIFRDAGRSLDVFGMWLQGNAGYKETLSRHRRITPLFGRAPQIASNAFIAPNASVIGQVELGENSSVWYGALLRGDVSKIQVGAFSIIGDRAVVNTPDYKRRLKTEFPDVVIGQRVTVGHGVILQGCTLEDGCFIDMGAIVGEGAVVGKNALVTAGSVVAPGTKIPAGEVWSGNPAQFERQLSPEELEAIKTSAENHYILSRKHIQVLHTLEEEIRLMRAVWEGRELTGRDAEKEECLCPDYRKAPMFDPTRPEHNHPPIGEVPSRV